MYILLDLRKKILKREKKINGIRLWRMGFGEEKKKKKGEWKKNIEKVGEDVRKKTKKNGKG